MTDRSGAKRVALLVEEEFDELQVREPLQQLRDAGIDAVLVGPLQGGEYRARRSEVTVIADLSAGKATAKDFDGVFIPGGYAPDRMRMRHAMVDLVRDMVNAGKPVAAIDHGPQLLISVGAVRGRTITCWPSIAVDVKNAGGRYVDRQVCEDGAVFTARKSDDIGPLVAAFLRALGQPALP